MDMARKLKNLQTTINLRVQEGGEEGRRNLQFQPYVRSHNFIYEEFE